MKSELSLPSARDKLLFTPGPLTTSLSVKQAMLHDAGSWHYEFNALVRQVREQLLAVAGLSRETGHEAVLLQGSGTFGIEAVFATCIPPTGKVVVLANGAYGERMVQILRLARIEHVALRSSENTPNDPAALDRLLEQDDAVTHVAAVHCETTTGILNPIIELGEVARRHGCSFIVDAMSTFGAMPIDFAAAGIDFLVSSPNKCLEGVPGFTFVIARREALLACEGSARSLSLDLLGQLKNFEKNGQFRFTPPTHAILALAQALRELEQEGGVAARGARYRRNHQILVAGMESLGFAVYLEKEVQSDIITSFHCPEEPGFTFDEFYRRLSDKGFIIYPGKISQANLFRIGSIGRLFEADLQGLLAAVSEVMTEMRLSSRGADSGSPRSPERKGDAAAVDIMRPGPTDPGEARSVAPAEGDVNHSPHRQAWTAQQLSDETRSCLAEDAKYFLHQSLSTPCLNLLARAGGAWIEDSQGRRYLDFHGNNVHQVGFGHPHVVAAIKEQLDQLPFCTRRYTCEPAIALARRLTELAPGNLQRVLFAPGGTSAIGMALKLARVATGRFKFVSMWDAFHGASLDAISVGGEAAFRQGIGPLLPGCEHVPPPDPHHCPFKCGAACSLACADYIDYVLEKEGDVAAVIGETVRCTPFIPPPDYWRRVRAACDRHGALLILDEIAVGLGRTGRLFACEHFEVQPDMLVLGKGLGGGVFPLAALLAREELNVAAGQALGHYTHEKNPVACAAGLATLEVIEKEKLVAHACTLGERTLAALRQLAARHPLIGDVRGLGLLLGVELLRNRAPGEGATAKADQVMYAALARGLSFKVTMGNILTLTPALTITAEEMEQAVNILDLALTEVEAGRSTAMPIEEAAPK